MESTIQVEDVQSFNTRLLKTIIEIQSDSSKTLWDADTPEITFLKEEFHRCENSWFKNAGLIDKYEPAGIDSYTGIYKPELFLSPHYHDPMVLITLYYLTDEQEDNDHQVSAHLIQSQTRATKAGHTVFMDPRGNIQLRENPNLPGIFSPLNGNASILEVYPQQGKMMTFAGHLLHWFMPTDTFRATITTGVDIQLRPGVLTDG